MARLVLKQLQSELGERCSQAWCVDRSHQHIFWHARWDKKNLNMSKYEFNENNYIPVDMDNLKDEQKVELERSTTAYKQECLKSFSATRAGDVIKKF